MSITKFISKKITLSLLASTFLMISMAAITNGASSWLNGWNNHGDFDLRPFDTGDISDQFFVDAPWGSDSWGIEASSFDKNNTEHTISGARFASWGNGVYLYGKEEEGYWSLVRYVQGDSWGGTYTGAVPWHVPDALSTYRKNLVLYLDTYRDTTNMFTSSESWNMFAINIWLNSPDLSKRIVLDLVFYQDCNWDNCGLAHYEDEHAYHYQVIIGETPYKEWKSWEISLSEHVENAIEEFELQDAKKSLKIDQLEYVIELKNAEGASMINNFSLVEER